MGRQQQPGPGCRPGMEVRWEPEVGALLSPPVCPIFLSLWRQQASRSCARQNRHGDMRHAQTNWQCERETGRLVGCVALS